MGNLLSFLTIANPVFTGTLTLLFFLETQKSKKRAEDLTFLLKDNSNALVRSTKDDFLKVSESLDSLANDTRDTTDSILDTTKLIQYNSQITKESFERVIKSNKDLQEGVIKSNKELQEDLINSLKKLNMEIESTNKAINELNDSLNSTMTL